MKLQNLPIHAITLSLVIQIVRTVGTDAINRKLKKKFDGLAQEYISSPEVQKMAGYIQHGDTTTLEHCMNVAWVSFLINEKLHLRAEEKELVEAALLHDFYLYDWHDGSPVRCHHGFDHPYIASRNAKKIFAASEFTQSCIKSHMWPLNPAQIPSSKEAIIICLADKYCALTETLKTNRVSLPQG